MLGFISEKALHLFKFKVLKSKHSALLIYSVFERSCGTC